MIRVAIADDNPVIRQGLVALLELSDDIAVVATAADGRQAVDVVGADEPDVLLLDVRMPLLDGVGVAQAVRGRVKVLMLTYSDEEQVVVGAIRAGASGYLVHGRFDADELTAAIRDVACGRPALGAEVAPIVLEAVRNQPEQVPASPVEGLTAREQEVMGLIATGLSNRVIAARLFVTEKTIKNHVNSIYSKMGVRSRGEAIATWVGLTAADAGSGNAAEAGAGTAGSEANAAT